MTCGKTATRPRPFAWRSSVRRRHTHKGAHHHHHYAGYTLAQIGYAQSLRGTPEEGLARLQPVVALLKASGAPYGLAALDAALGALLFCTGHYREALAAAERAAVFARAVGDRKLLATAAERSAWALLHMGGRTEDHLHHPGGALSEGGAGRAAAR